MFKLNQARSENWSLALDPIRIISLDAHKTDIQARSHVFNQIMAGSAYHIEAFQIITSQNKDAIALVPDVRVGGWVKLTASVTMQVTGTVQVPNPDYGSTIEPGWEDVPQFIEQVDVREVAIPAGTICMVTGRGQNKDGGAQISVSVKRNPVPSTAEHTFDDQDEQWFPFEVIELLTVHGNYGTLIADRKTGAVLRYDASSDATEENSYEDVAVIDVAELKTTLGELPDMIDIVLVGYTAKDGSRMAPERDDWIKVRLDHLEDRTLAAILYARCGLQAD